LPFHIYKTVQPLILPNNINF